jgi:hypothetical protein
MAVQANRESIMRHYNKSCAADPNSDSDKENSVDAEQLQSAKDSINASSLKNARAVFRELRYPQQVLCEKSESIMKPQTDAIRPLTNIDLAAKLSCAINEEFEVLAQSWGVECPGQEQRMEDRAGDRVAYCLKKVARRAEKSFVEALACQKVMTSQGDSGSAELQALALDDECAELEAQIAAADQRVASMKNVLSADSYISRCSQQYALKNLADRLSTNLASENTLSSQAVEFESTMNDSVESLIQRLVAAGSLLPHRQKEILSERHVAMNQALIASLPSALGAMRSLT